MAVIRITRFRCTPENEEQMLRGRAALVAAVRRQFVGLAEARLGRSVVDGTWVDVWLWDSRMSLQAAVDARLPEAGAALRLVTDVAVEVVDLVEQQ